MLRIDGAVLLDVLEQAPMLTDGARPQPGRPAVVVDEPEVEPALVDDPRWVDA